jgi:hypothetical protein
LRVALSIQCLGLNNHDVNNNKTINGVIIDMADVKAENDDNSKNNNASDPRPHDEESNHELEQKQHQEEKTLEECDQRSTTTTTSRDSITNMDDSHLRLHSDNHYEKDHHYDYHHRGSCSSLKDVCVTRNKMIGGTNAFMAQEDSSYNTSGYCVPISDLEVMDDIYTEYV